MGCDHLAARGSDGLTHLNLVDMFAVITSARWIGDVNVECRLGRGVDDSDGIEQIDPLRGYGIFIWPRLELDSRAGGNDNLV
jgi:hypothetical protein